MRTYLFMIVKETFIDSWWVILFILFCFAGFERGLLTINENHRTLLKQLTFLQEEKKVALKEHERLSMQVRSQSDPYWIELTLMRELGLTPAGQTKVYFK